MAHPPHRHRKRTDSQPAATIGLRAAQVVEQQRVEIRANLGAALDGRDPEGVHDMRVASRRLRACLQLFVPWLEKDDLERTGSAIRAVTRALGRVRELDVLRLRLTGFSRQARPERALALEALDSRLEQRRRRARARMMARFAKVDLDRLDHRLRRLVAHLETSGNAAVATDGTASPDTTTNARVDPATVEGRAVAPAFAPATLLVGFAAADIRGAVHDALDREIPEEVGSTAAAEELHQVRIAAKKLRYLLEIAAPYVGDTGPTLVKRLKALQDGLGDFHDDAVLDAVLSGAIEDASERDRTLLARELRRFRTLRRRALARDERAVRAAIVALRDSGFASAIEDALTAAGAGTSVAEEPPPPELAVADRGADATIEHARAESAMTVRRRAATTLH